MRLLIAFFILVAAPALWAQQTPDLMLAGQITGKDNRSYRNVRFEVPSGVTRITVDFSYTGHKRDHTTIDMGLLGPQGFAGQNGFRGWSGGARKVFTVAATDATPGYLPGAIIPGQWTLVLGIPNIHPQARSRYQVKIWFARSAATAWGPAVLNPPLRNTAGWYRGDLHMHTAHSDGSCDSQSGKIVPCPLFLTVEAAAERGLDFIALSEHNTVSQFSNIRELQPYFNRLLLMPAREVTTFQGHANLFGVVRPVDFRVGTATVPDWNALLENIAADHGLISINHPIRPNDETCMGCGWTPGQAVDMHRIQAVEAVNGIDAMLPDSGIAFWQKQLDLGFRLTGIGGSDNHHAPATVAGPSGSIVGTPTTVVHASALSMPAILAGIRAGHVFIDTQGTRDRLLDLTASQNGNTADMGDALAAPARSAVHFSIHVAAVEGGRVEIIADGKPMPILSDTTIHSAKQNIDFRWASDGRAHWLRANVRGPSGELWLVGNPIYINH